MIQFEKVEKAFFLNDASEIGLPFDRDFFSDCYDEIELPTRSTAGSAGYDFRTPFPFSLPPGQTILIPSGIKARMNKFNYLSIHIRSSMALKHGLALTNQTSIIDSDYYGNESNDGDIFLGITNRGPRTFRAEAGDRIAQGIFNQYDIADNDTASVLRQGGVGSTGI